MNKLVIALLTEDNKLQKFEEIDMSWVDQFNKDFEKQTKESGIPFSKSIYEEELVEMASYSVLNSMVSTSDDEQFRVDREPLKEILRKLLNDEQKQSL